MLPLLFKFYLPVQVACSCKTANALKRLKNTHREKTPSNKTTALRKSTNMGVWATGTLNKLFIRDSWTEKKIQKNKLVIAKLRSLW